MKNPLALLFFGVMLAVLAYPFLASSGAGKIGPELNQTAPRPESCRDGETRPCSVNACAGTSVCAGGSWSGCTWEQKCVPGAKVSCIREGCVYAFRECDDCGSGYGECVGVPE
ncbi:MAG: hypothetical protein AB1324_06060 [Candidatus Micrarchaeota archaeon]